jgi:hypothetical protein
VRYTPPSSAEDDPHRPAHTVSTDAWFTRGRIAFLDAGGHAAVPTQGQAFFYYGDQAERFTQIFRVCGFVR